MLMKLAGKRMVSTASKQISHMRYASSRIFARAFCLRGKDYGVSCVFCVRFGA